MITSAYTPEELAELGFKSCGANVLISRLAKLDDPHAISVGSGVKIGDFSTLSGDITLGNEVLIGEFSGLFGDITIGNNVTIMARSALNGRPPVGLPDLKVPKTPIVVKDNVVIEPECIILPGITLEEGTLIKMHSLVNASTEPSAVYSGRPARRVNP